jgi:hypothetical protein
VPARATQAGQCRVTKGETTSSTVRARALARAYAPPLLSYGDHCVSRGAAACARVNQVHRPKRARRARQRTDEWCCVGPMAARPEPRAGYLPRASLATATRHRAGWLALGWALSFDVLCAVRSLDRCTRFSLMKSFNSTQPVRAPPRPPAAGRHAHTRECDLGVRRSRRTSRASACAPAPRRLPRPARGGGSAVALALARPQRACRRRAAVSVPSPP